MFKKQIFIILTFLSIVSPLHAQIDIQEINTDLFPYLTTLLSRAEKDIAIAIENDSLNERVAITRFEASGIRIEEKYRTYTIKSFETFNLKNKFFHLVGSVEALNRTVIVDSRLELYSNEQLRELERLSKELDADYYAIINLTALNKTLSLSLIIKSVSDHSIVWGKEWSTILRKGTRSFNVGFYQGITIPVGYYPFFFHFGFDKKVYTFLDFGLYLDPGLVLLFQGSNNSVIGMLVNFGLKASIDMLNIFLKTYPNVELPLYVKAGFNFSYYTSHTIIPAAEGTPFTGIGIRPGIGVVINRDYVIFLEYDYKALVTAEMGIFTGFYYRLEF